MAVVIETTKGVFTVDLYVDHRPKVCKNFLKLCKAGFYNFSLFHSVQPRFIAQAGRPAGRDRDQGESIYRRLYGDQARFFEGDLLPKITHGRRGSLSMVSAGGSNMFGSQFFVTLDDGLDYLDADHCVFGEVSDGLDEIVAAFNETICDGEEHRPYQDLRIAHTVVLEDPFDDPEGFEAAPDRSPTAEQLATTRIAADEDFAEYEGLNEEELAEVMAEKEAKAQATILEMVGDLPEADCAPPENVLFVCKLNPVTTDDDLEIIFSRFGKVVGCEVIRDGKTDDSLQYAFVEFEEEKACESAYFKMDNVLIDDRRIHVDFSQSVSKYRWKGKGRLEVMPGEGGGDGNRRSRSRSRERRRRRRSRSPESKRRRHRSRSAKRHRRTKSRSRSRDRKRSHPKHRRR